MHLTNVLDLKALMVVIAELLSIPSNLIITFKGVVTVKDIPPLVTLYVDCSVTIVDSVTDAKKTIIIESDWKTEDLIDHARRLLEIAPSKHIRLFAHHVDAATAGERVTSAFLTMPISTCSVG